MRWISRLEDVARGEGFGAPIAWLFADDDPGVAAAAALARSTPDDLADAARARHAGGAPRLLRRRVLRALAARAFDVHPDAPVFTREPGGAVRLVGPQPAHVGAAGRKGWSVVALASGPIGVDVEPVAEAGVRDWVCHEATLKMCGRGLGTALPARTPRYSFRETGGMLACACVPMHG